MNTIQNQAIKHQINLSWAEDVFLCVTGDVGPQLGDLPAGPRILPLSAVTKVSSSLMLMWLSFLATLDLSSVISRTTVSPEYLVQWDGGKGAAVVGVLGGAQ